jgi:hypothetical protein
LEEGNERLIGRREREVDWKKGTRG